MSRNIKLKSVIRIKKRFPRPDLAHLDRSTSEPETKPTIKKASTPPPRPVSQTKPVDTGSPEVRSPEAGSCVSADRPQCSEYAAAHEPLSGASTLAAPADKADASTFVKSKPSQESSSGIPVEPLADTDESASGQAGSLVQRKLKRLSLPELQRYAKQSAKGADNAILEHAGLSSLLDEKLAEIKDTKTPKDASEDVRTEYNEKRAQLRKERDAISRKKTISYENAVALERAADEYAAVVAMLLDRPEVDYRRQPRLNEKHIDLTDEEKLALIERFLSSGRFSKHDAPASQPMILAEASGTVAPEASDGSKPGASGPDSMESAPSSAPASTSEDTHPASPVADTDGGSDDKGGTRGRGMLYALLLLFAVIILILMWFCTSKKTSTADSSLTAVSSTATTTISSSSTEIQGTAPALGVQTITQDEQIAIEPNGKSVAPEPISESAGEGVGPTVKATVVSLSEPTVQTVPALEKAVPDSPVFSSEPTEKEVSVSGNVDCMGYAVSVQSYDGFAEVSYPSSITTKEASSFLIHEYALYADSLSAASYTFVSPGLVRIDYPVGISVDDRRYAVDRFCKDLIAYAEGLAVASTPVSMREDTEGEPSVIASGLSDQVDADSIPSKDLSAATVVAALPASGEAPSTVDVPADAAAKTNTLKLTAFIDNEAAGTSPAASEVPVDRTKEDGISPIAVEATAVAVAGPEASSGRSGNGEPSQIVVPSPVVFSERQPAVTELEPAVAVAVPTVEPVSQSVGTDKPVSLLTFWGAPFSFKAVDILSSNYAYYSSYGAGSGLSYDYRFPTGTTLGLDIGFLWHKISYAPYYDLPVIARFGYRWEGSKWSFGMMFGAGVMIARYEGVTQYSLLCATSMELHRWMTEKLGLSLRLTGLMSENSLLPSGGSFAMISYELPVFLGLTFRF
jgi:phage terminase Nu1 subunit (DNA packaging protein)